MAERNGKIWGRKGYEIRDDDGRLVATLAIDVYFDEPIRANQFILPDGSHPNHGERLPPAVERFMVNGCRLGDNAAQSSRNIE